MSACGAVAKKRSSPPAVAQDVFRSVSSRIRKAVPSSPTPDADPAQVDALDAELSIFGEDPRPAQLSVWIRSRAWRLRGTLTRLGATAIAAPLAFLIPPHAPWGVGVLAGGLLLARRRWTEHLTVASFRGHCPRCGSDLTLAPGTRLLSPHAMPCESCHHEVLLHPGSVASSRAGRP